MVDYFPKEVEMQPIGKKIAVTFGEGVAESDGRGQ